MKDVGQLIRTKVYDRLFGVLEYNGDTIPVYDSAGVPANAIQPYVLLSTFNATELLEGSKQSYGQEISLLIEVCMKFDNSFGGKIICDNISNQITELIRTRQEGYLDLSPDWYIIRTLLESTNSLEQPISTGVLTRRFIRFTFKIQQQ
jgi:hypothetical protein